MPSERAETLFKGSRDCALKATHLALPQMGRCRQSLTFHPFILFRASQRENHQGLGANEVEAPNENDNEYDAYRKRMMLAYRFRPNPLVSFIELSIFSATLKFNSK